MSPSRGKRYTPSKQCKRFLGMHRWEHTLTEEQVHDLTAYIRSEAPHVKVKP